MIFPCKKYKKVQLKRTNFTSELEAITFAASLHVQPLNVIVFFSFFFLRKGKGLTERRRLVPRVCPSSSKSPGPVVLRGKSHGEQIIPCQEFERRRRRAPAFETEEMLSLASFARTETKDAEGDSRRSFPRNTKFDVAISVVTLAILARVIEI